jgi:hypothetical protein
MSLFLNYNSLVDQLKIAFNRNDRLFTDSIDLFISLGQRRIAPDLKILGLKNAITGNLYPGNNIIQKPNRWLNSVSFNIGIESDFADGDLQFKEILLRPRTFCEQYWPFPSKTNVPKYYSDGDYNNFIIYPTPDLNYSYNLYYYEFPVLINEIENSNFLTINAPELLFYSCCIDAAIIIQDSQRQIDFTNAYEKIKSSFSQEDMNRIKDEFSTY